MFGRSLRQQSKQTRVTNLKFLTSLETAKAMIEASELKIANDSITLVIDHSGIYYRIPIACINEPAKFVESQ